MGLQQAIATVSDPASVMDRVLAEALVLIPSAEGAAVLLCTEPTFLDYSASIGNLGGATGTRVAIAHSLSGLALSSGATQRSDKCEKRFTGRWGPGHGPRDRVHDMRTFVPVGREGGRPLDHLGPGRCIWAGS